MNLTVPAMIAKFVRGVYIAALVLVFSTMLSATTLDAYKAKIDELRKLAIRIENSIRTDESSEVDLREFVNREFVGQIRKELPASERVEWEGGTVETSNDWLLGKVRDLESETDSKKRHLTIVEIREYLSAVLFKLEELEQAKGIEQTKDQDKQKLAEILRREEYQKPQPKQEGGFQRWLGEFLEWLERVFPKSSGPAQGFSGMGVLTVLLQVLIWGALLAVLGFLIYKIVPRLFPQLRRTRKPKKKKERIILGEHLSEDATAVDLFDEAEQLAREGNLRGAIRKGYIALLCDLSDRKVIGLARNKTNRDYLRDVRSRRELHPRMRSVTETFERHWYGFQDSADEDWIRFREEYKEALRSVSA
jgi:hypothetical protein